LETGSRQDKTQFTPHFETGQDCKKLNMFSFEIFCRRQSWLILSSFHTADTDKTRQDSLVLSVSAVWNRFYTNCQVVSNRETDHKLMMANQLRNRNNLATWESINDQPKYEKSLDLSLGDLKNSPDLATKSLNWQHRLKISSLKLRSCWQWH